MGVSFVAVYTTNHLFSLKTKVVQLHINSENLNLDEAYHTCETHLSTSVRQAMKRRNTPLTFDLNLLTSQLTI